MGCLPPRRLSPLPPPVASQVAAHALRGGRERPFSPLASANTPHRKPVALAVVVGIQATAVVVQAVLAAATVRGSRPPVAVGAGKVERAIEVEPTIDRRESGGVASNASLFVASW